MKELFDKSRVLHPTLFVITTWVEVEMAGVLGAQGVHDLAVDLEAVGPWTGERGREV